MVKKVKESEKPPRETKAKAEESKIVENPDAQKDEIMDEQNKEDISAFQLKERKKRTVFVGNVPVSATAKQL